jgi:hypothetical protein
MGAVINLPYQFGKQLFRLDPSILFEQLGKQPRTFVA